VFRDSFIGPVSHGVSMTPDRRALLGGGGAALVLGGLGFAPGIVAFGRAQKALLTRPGIICKEVLSTASCDLACSDPRGASLTQPWLFQVKEKA